MRVIVCGGRNYTDRKRLFAVLDEIHAETPITWLVEGDARGADRLANLWRRQRDVPGQSYPADWNQYGKAAGSIRNAEMLRRSSPYLVIAFPGGAGTQDMCARAEKTGIPVLRVGW